MPAIHPQLGPAQPFDTCMVGVNGRLARTRATPITDGIRPSEYSSALSLLSLAFNCCDVTLGDMLTFKTCIVGGKLRIRKSQLQTQLGFAEYW
jgi:predicted molibdopterin-dependent oxidoreductase YjgC